MPLEPLTNPITTVGRVAYNARRDNVDLRKRRRGNDTYDQKVYDKGPAVSNGTSAEIYSIHPHDLLLMNKSHKKRRIGRTNDTDIHVFASANNVRVDNPKPSDTQGDKRLKLREELTFGGIATNAARYDEHNNNNEETFASQFGGLCTIVNTGKEDIYAGDYVMWDLPRNEDKMNQWKHAPKSKALFVVKPFRYDKVDSDDVADVATQMKAVLDAAGADVDENIKQMLTVFRKAHFDTTRRCFGRAMSNGKPNDSFDVLLGNYCA